MALPEQTRSYAVQRRRDIVAECLAKLMFDADIVDFCQRHPAFETADTKHKPGKGVGPQRRRILSRMSIRNHYLYPMRRELREQELDPMEELHKAYAMLQAAYRMAVKNEDAGGMSRATHEIAKLLGLRKRPGDSPEATTERLRKQLEAMAECME